MELQPLPPQRQAGIQKALASIHKSEVRIEARRSTAASSDPTLRGRNEAAVRKRKPKRRRIGGRPARVALGPMRPAGRAGIGRGGAVDRTRQLDRDRGALDSRRHARSGGGDLFISAGNNRAGEGSSGNRTERGVDHESGHAHHLAPGGGLHARRADPRPPRHSSPMARARDRASPSSLDGRGALGSGREREGGEVVAEAEAEPGRRRQHRTSRGSSLAPRVRREQKKPSTPARARAHVVSCGSGW